MDKFTGSRTRTHNRTSVPAYTVVEKAMEENQILMSGKQNVQHLATLANNVVEMDISRIVANPSQDQNLRKINRSRLPATTMFRSTRW